MEIGYGTLSDTARARLCPEGRLNLYIVLYIALLHRVLLHIVIFYCILHCFILYSVRGGAEIRWALSSSLNKHLVDRGVGRVGGVGGAVHRTRPHTHAAYYDVHYV